MPTTWDIEPPLRSPDTVRSHSVGDLRDAVQQHTVVHDVETRRGQPNGLVASTGMGTMNLVYVRYGTRVRVDAFPTRNRFALTVPLGPMRVSAPGSSQSDPLCTGFVLSQERHTLMDPDPIAGALVVSTSMARLEDHLAGLTGRIAGRALRFLPPGEGASVGPSALLDASWRLVCQTLNSTGGERVSPLLVRNLEDVLLSGILLSLPHNGVDDLVHDDARAPTGIADRARDWLEEHYEEPVTVTDMARALRISVRQLQYVFASHFGATPTEILRDIRLANARRLLNAMTSNTATTIAEAAYACGFSHLSRFSIAYRERFGESPSETVRRVRGL